MRNDIGLTGRRADETPPRALAATAVGTTACPQSSTDQTASRARQPHMEWCFYRSGHLRSPTYTVPLENRRALQQCPTIAEARGTRGHCCTLSRAWAYSKLIFERGCSRSLARTHTTLCGDCTASVLTLLQLRSLWTGMFLSPPSMAASGSTARVAARLSPARKSSPSLKSSGDLVHCRVPATLLLFCRPSVASSTEF